MNDGFKHFGELASRAVRQFRIEIPQADLDSLHGRLDNARWPGELPGVEWTRGIPLGYLKELADYWRTQYDWRAQEAKLNQYSQFITDIDGQRIHFLHVRSDQADAKPLLITHGFPSSVAEFLHLIEPLVNPARGQAFHVVAPSLPGYAFSTPLDSTGWAMGRTARAWVELIRRLGYERYGVHGGDIGAGVSGTVAGLDGEHVIGVHVVTDPLTAANTATFLPGMADRLDQDDPIDKLIIDRMKAFTKDGSGYLAIQNSRPQTIGYGLVDSPLLQLAWIAEKVHEWTDLPAPHQREPVLVHRLRRHRRAYPVRAGTLLRLGRAADRTAGLRGLRRRRDSTQAGSRARRCPLDRVQTRQALPGDGGSGRAGGGPAGIFRAATVTDVLSQRGLTRATPARQHLLEQLRTQPLGRLEVAAAKSQQAGRHQRRRHQGEDDQRQRGEIRGRHARDVHVRRQVDHPLWKSQESSEVDHHRRPDQQRPGQPDRARQQPED
jgi:hypothetical protein